MRGFTLLELMVSIAIGIIIASLAGALVWHIFILPKRSSEELSLSMGIERLSLFLGRDVREAVLLKKGKNPVYLDIRKGDGTRIRYTFSDGILRKDKVEINLVRAEKYEDFTVETDNMVKAKYGDMPILAARKGFEPSERLSIFSESDLVWIASSSEVIGDVHSNSNIKVEGKDIFFLGILEGMGIKKRGIVYAEFENEKAMKKKPPFNISRDDLKPYTFKFKGNVDLARVDKVWEGKRLKSGVYFATGTMKLKKSHIRGKVTFIADTIIIEGRGISLEPARKNVLLFAERIKLALKSSSLGGILYSPRGFTYLKGDEVWLYGGIISERTEIIGRGIRIETPKSLYGSS